MSKPLFHRIDFGNEAGDDVDPEELTTYFVEQDLFTKMLNGKQKLAVAVGKKGLGKSALLQWISHRVSNENPDVLVVKIRGSDSPVQVAHYLYQIGFVVARSDENSGYEHYSFEQMPDFLSSRTNDDFGMSWEIHPCYREALDIVKLNKAKRDKMMQQRRVARNRPPSS